MIKHSFTKLHGKLGLAHILVPPWKLLEHI